MRYKFNEVNDVTGFISELLHEFNLPTVDVITDDTRLVHKGQYYIKDLNLYRCTKDNYKVIQEGKTLNYIVDPKWVETNLQEIFNYSWGKSLFNFTKNYPLHNHVYDTELHEYLGDYLRFLRDYKRLNLMPLYNCFSNKTVNSININVPVVTEYDSESILTPIKYFNIKANDSLYNYYLVPVKLGQVYTIAIDSMQPIEMACLLYEDTLISTNSKIIRDNIIKATYKKINVCNFNTPFLYSNLKDILYSIDITNLENYDIKDYNMYLDNIKLVLKVPSSNTSSIVILEGDYSKTNDSLDGTLIPHGHFGSFNKLRDSEGNLLTIVRRDYLRNFPSKLALLYFNDKQHHPFSNRLVEYLTDYSITHLDELPENIARVQAVILWMTKQSLQGNYGIWNRSINDKVYKFEYDSYVDFYKRLPFIYNKRNDYRWILPDSEGKFPTDNIGNLVWNNGWTDLNSEGKNILGYSSFRQIKDVYNDLLTFVDKDIEGYFLSNGGK